MRYFFASLISSVFSTFLFFHFSISVSRINAAVEIRKKNYIKAHRIALCFFMLYFCLIITVVNWLSKSGFYSSFCFKIAPFSKKKKGLLPMTSISSPFTKSVTSSGKATTFLCFDTSNRYCLLSSSFSAVRFV